MTVAAPEREQPGADVAHPGPPILAVSPRAAGRCLGVGHDAVYQLLNEGRLRSVKLGRRRLIPVSELQRFLREELA